MKVCPVCGREAAGKTIENSGRQFSVGCETCNSYIYCLTDPNVSDEAKEIAIRWASKTLDSGMLSEEDSKTVKLWKENALAQQKSKADPSSPVNEKRGNNEPSLEKANKLEKTLSVFVVFSAIVFAAALTPFLGWLGIIIGLIVGGILGNGIYAIGTAIIENSQNAVKMYNKLEKLEKEIEVLKSAVITEEKEQ